MLMVDRGALRAVPQRRDRARADLGLATEFRQTVSAMRFRVPQKEQPLRLQSDAGFSHRLGQ